MKKLFTRADLIIAAVVLLSGLALLCFKPSGEGETAIIRVDGKEYKKIDLQSTENFEITVNGVVIACENKEIYVKSSTCPDKICVGAGHLTKSGQSAVCVPNRVSVEISGKGEGTPWAVTG